MRRDTDFPVGHGSTLQPTERRFSVENGHPLYDAKCGYDPLREAALALYYAGRWEIPVENPDKPHPCTADAQAALWERLRDALGLQPGTATALGTGTRRATPDEVRQEFTAIERNVIRGLISEKEIENKRLRERVVGLLEANNREIFKRREGERLLVEAASLFRFYEEHHRSKVEPAAPESSPAELDEAIERLRKAEVNAEIARRIETLVGGGTAPSPLCEVVMAARALRYAQRAYMADRGNEELGKAVGAAAAELDRVLGDA